jgi:hypothetical protein
VWDGCTHAHDSLGRERGLARRHKRGAYLIERRAVEEVLTVLKEWI